MQIDISIAFFILGVIAALVRSDIQFPKALYQSLILFLMIAIGLKGGMALAEHASWQLLRQSIYIVLMGLLLPLIAFPVLHYIGLFKRQDAASIAAHYGSVSVGTYAVAVAYLEMKEISYEAYIPLFVVLLEMPAIVVGILLAKQTINKPEKNNNHQTEETLKLKRAEAIKAKKSLLHEMFFNQGMLLMVGSLLIGYMAGAKTYSVAPLFFELFGGVLALFLLEMGMVAGSKFKQIKSTGNFLLTFGIAMPLVGGIIGSSLGWAIGLSTGGAILVSVLGASASYIAVPAAMRVVLPNANHSLSISAALGITFPFNVLIGIPTYTVITQWLMG